MALEDVVGPIAILNNVHPDKAVRDAADAAMRDISSFHVEVLQNEALFDRVRAVTPATPTARAVKEGPGRGLRGQRRGAAAGQARAREGDLRPAGRCSARISRATSATTTTRVTFTPRGDGGHARQLPRRAHERRDEDGNYVLALDYPSYFIPFMANARIGDARRRYYMA